jgi:hypothetical protein
MKIMVMITRFKKQRDRIAKAVSNSTINNIRKIFSIMVKVFDRIDFNE